MARDIRIAYDFSHVPTVRRMSKSKAKVRGLRGPFGSGKSSGCIMELIRWATQDVAPCLDGVRRSRFCIVRNTYRQLHDTTIRTIMDWLPEQLFGRYVKADNVYTITAFPDCEIEFWFRALDRPDQVGNLLSSEYTGAWVNEAREVPFAIIEALDGRLGRYPSNRMGGWTPEEKASKVRKGMIFDTNPPDDDSWWYKRFETERPSSWEQFVQPSGLSAEAENLPNLPAGYYSDLIEGKGKSWADVYVHGRYGYVQDGLPVFPEFADDLHVTPEPLKPVPGKIIYRGFDWGLTPACVFCQVSPSGHLLVLDEITSTRLGVEGFGEVVSDYSARTFPDFQFEDIGDPAGTQAAQTDERTCFQIMNAMGFNMRPGVQTLTARLESVRRTLTSLRGGKPIMRMSPKCAMLRKGMNGRYMYRRIRVSEERYTSEPDKNDYSHVADALQYVCSVLFPAPQMLAARSYQKPIVSSPPSFMSM